MYLNVNDCQKTTTTSDGSIKKKKLFLGGSKYPERSVKISDIYKAFEVAIGLWGLTSCFLGNDCSEVLL